MAKVKFIRYTQQWDFCIIHSTTMILKGEYIGSYFFEESVDNTLLNGVYIDEQHRRKGFGNILLNDIQEQIKKREYRKTYLMVKKDNNVAKEMYKKAGFRFSSNQDRYEWMIKKNKYGK